MTADMGVELDAALSQLAGEEGLRCVVLTGEGEAFSAGGDLDMLETFARLAREEGFDATAPMREFYGRYLSVRELPVPVIAAVNGHAIGAGLCVALACDILIVAGRAQMGLNFSRIGIHPGMGATWLLPRAVGWQRAAELLFTGRLFTGIEAVEMGMALEAPAAHDVLRRAMVLAGEIAASAPLVIRDLKRSLNESSTRTLQEQLDIEATRQAASYGTADVIEGLTAARARRTPNFRGE